MPSRIVTYVHRPKRPPRKQKAVVLQAIVAKASNRNPTPRAEPQTAPANDDRKSAIVATKSRKRAKQRPEPATEPDDPEGGRPG